MVGSGKREAGIMTNSGWTEDHVGGRQVEGGKRKRRRTAIVAGLFAVFAAVAAVPAAAPAIASSTQISITSAAGYPNERIPFYGDVPANAIDGDINTFTWTTNPNNTAIPSHLAIGFASSPVDRIRLWKDSYGGGGNNSKNLTIEYTTDGGPLS